jgi:hypothetical protein
LPRAASLDTPPHRVDSTPHRRKRRSLGDWWAESAAARQAAREESSHTIALTPDREADDNTSESSAMHPPPHNDPVKLLNRMTRQSKRLSVERKRQQMDQLAQDSEDHLPTEYSLILDSTPRCPPMVTSFLGPMRSGNRSWLRSLRQSQSCPAVQHMPRLTLAREPNMHTASRARIRTPRRDSEGAGVSLSVSESVRLSSRERAALEKHLERAAARSLSRHSRKSSASATPERSTSRHHSRTYYQEASLTPQPRTSLRHQHSGKRHTAHRSASAEVHTGTSAGYSPFTRREHAALHKHLERLAACQHDPQHSGTDSSEQATSGCRLSSEDSESLERSHPLLPSIVCGFEKHLGRGMHPEMVARPRTSSSGETVSAEAAAAETPSKKPEVHLDEESASKAKPEERAEHARAVTQAKFEQARATQRAKICVFKRTGKLPSQLSPRKAPVASNSGRSAGARDLKLVASRP